MNDPQAHQQGENREDHMNSGLPKMIELEIEKVFLGESHLLHQEGETLPTAIRVPSVDRHFDVLRIERCRFQDA